MQNNKTFRLFISSTFNDFRGERKALQKVVFPEIKDYCADKGLSFQPIDLRWGVSNEAQLDQKALDLCLNEVRSCKLHPAPNFLLMLGDRYGWVPLPYHIKKEEFESLCKLMPEDELSKTKEWYQLDENQIPPSYVLQERTGDYKVYKNWGKVEVELRKILQAAVENSSFDKDKRNKYFESATKAEIVEGVLPYLGLTDFQKTLIKAQPGLSEIDTNGVFGFLRSVHYRLMDKRKVGSRSLLNSRFEKKPSKKDRGSLFSSRLLKKVTVKKRAEISDFFETANSLENSISLKKQISEVLKSNVYSASTVVRENKELDTGYLLGFSRRTEEFLKNRVDEQLKTNDPLSELDQEIKAHKDYAHQKTQNFIGQGTILDQINDYCKNYSQSPPLVIYGPSGCGKSAIMAEAFQKQAKDSKTIIRFVGVTPNTNGIKPILYSIFEQLDIDVRSTQEKESDKQIQEGIQNRLALDSKDNESFEDFSYRMHDQIMQLKPKDKNKNIMIFIDAVDQLSHKDQFLWLPETLPSNVKIIISSLKDTKYKEDSEYFEDYLQGKVGEDQCIEVQEFNGTDGLGLLEVLLKQGSRQLQPHQEAYFKKQFNSSLTPLYVTLAAQEVVHWKSFDRVKDKDIPNQPKKGLGKIWELADTQWGVVKEFIENLSKLYHHEPALVERVLGYISASKDGLSESEILTLINQDQQFIDTIATDQFHKKETSELPMAIWARLQMMLKPFLSQKQQDGETLLYFFHREFETVIEDEFNRYDTLESIFNATQRIVKVNLKRPFYSNRWGKLFSILITSEHLLVNSAKLEHWFKGLGNDGWLINWFKYYQSIGLKNIYAGKLDEALLVYKIKDLATYSLKDRSAISSYTAESKVDLASIYYEKGFTKELVKAYENADFLFNKALIFRDEKSFDAEHWNEGYIAYLLNVSHTQMDPEAARVALSHLERLREYDSPKWMSEYLRALRINAELSHDGSEIQYLEKGIGFVKDLYASNPDLWFYDYVLFLNNIGEERAENKDYVYAIRDLKAAIDILKPKLEINSSKFSTLYATVSINLANNILKQFKDNKEVLEVALNYVIKAKELSEKFSKISSKRWIPLDKGMFLTIGNIQSVINGLEVEKSTWFLIQQLKDELDKLEFDSQDCCLNSSVDCCVGNFNKRQLILNKLIELDVRKSLWKLKLVETFNEFGVIFRGLVEVKRSCKCFVDLIAYVDIEDLMKGYTEITNKIASYYISAIEGLIFFIESSDVGDEISLPSPADLEFKQKRANEFKLQFKTFMEDDDIPF